MYTILHITTYIHDVKQDNLTSNRSEMGDGCIYWWAGAGMGNISVFPRRVVMNGDMPGPLFLLRATRNVVTSPRTVRDKYRDTLVIVIPNSHRAVSLMMKSGAGN